MHYRKNAAEDIYLIAQAARGDEVLIAAEVASGQAEFFTLGDCHFVVRTEQTERGKELVLVCAQGRNLRRPLHSILANAIRQGYNCLRYHPDTKKAGLALGRIGGLPVHWFDDEQYFITYFGEE